MEILGPHSLTEAAGPHPLFNGVRKLTVTGLASKPTVSETDDIVTMQSEGVTLNFRDAEIVEGLNTLNILLP